ncbi:hypothetical protein BDR05DRAFT_550483 [Suillus weaverae]|nr:hypothetical protein BDR05DRAFT_550483 [Suillus weaverae]
MKYLVSLSSNWQKTARRTARSPCFADLLLLVVRIRTGPAQDLQTISVILTVSCPMLFCQPPTSSLPCRTHFPGAGRTPEHPLLRLLRLSAGESPCGPRWCSSC